MTAVEQHRVLVPAGPNGWPMCGTCDVEMQPVGGSLGEVVCPDCRTAALIDGGVR